MTSSFKDLTQCDTENDPPGSLEKMIEDLDAKNSSKKESSNADSPSLESTPSSVSKTISVTSSSPAPSSRKRSHEESDHLPAHEPDLKSTTGSPDLINIPFSVYSREIRESFEKNATIIDSLEPPNEFGGIWPTRGRQTIGDQVDWYMRLIDTKDTSRYVLDMLSLMLLGLRDYNVMKRLFASTSPELFVRYFPSLKDQLSLYAEKSIQIGNRIIENFPDFNNYSNPNIQPPGALGNVIEALMKKKKDIDVAWRVMAGEDDLMISLLVRQWRGKSRDGIKFIMRMVQDFHNRYGDKPKLYKPEMHLTSILDYQPDTVKNSIQCWYDQLTSEKPYITPVALLDSFSKRPMILFNPPDMKWRPEKRIVDVTEKVHVEYTRILKRQRLLDEFFQINVIQSPKTKVTRKKAVAKNATKDAARDTAKDPAKDQT